LPEPIRRHQVGTLLGPSTGWFMRERIVGRMPLMLGCTPQAATTRDGKVHLRVLTARGHQRDVVSDHLIAATGYKVDLRRLSFLTDRLHAQLRTVNLAPVLSSNFESSIPGLFFVGPVSMNSFGPVVRFVFGDRYTASRIARHLAGSPVRGYVPAQAAIPG
jgi:hypothetical protein